MTIKNRLADTNVVIAAVLVMIAAVLFSIRPLSDSDFWHHIAFGRFLIEDGIFPRTDLLGSTSEGRPWVSSGWLPATLLYIAYTAFPVYGPAFFVAAIVALTGLLLLAVGVIRTRRPALAALVVLSALAASHPRFLPRPDLLSQLMLPLLLLALSWLDDTARQPPALRRRLAWAAVPALFILWANLHMLFVIGLAVLTIYTAATLWEHRRNLQETRPLLLIWLTSILACLLTPNGWRSAWFIIENARLHSASSRINELKPFLTIIGEPGAAVLFTLLAAWLSVAIYTGVMARRHGSPIKRWHVAAALFIIAVGLSQRRQVGLAVPSLTMLIFLLWPTPGTNPAPVPRTRRSKTRLGPAGTATPDLWLRNSALFIPAVFLVLTQTFLTKAGSLPSPAHPARMAGINCHWFPCEAVTFLRKNPPPGRFFHDLYTGSFLAYHLHPETRVFMDGRLEVYNNGTYDDFFAPPEGRMSVLELFDKYQINSALLDWRDAYRQPTSTAAILSSHPQWRLCWFSDNYALFVRETPATQPYLSAHAYNYLNPLTPDRYLTALQNPTTRPAATAEAHRAKTENPQSHLAQTAISAITP